jgi:hypothetical protein
MRIYETVGRLVSLVKNMLNAAGAALLPTNAAKKGRASAVSVRRHQCVDVTTQGSLRVTPAGLASSAT